MDEDIDFECPLSEKKVLEIEKMIKTYLRKYSINTPEEKDIERYTDRYNESVLITDEELKNYIYSDILSPEISHFLGIENKTSVNNVVDKINIEESDADSIVNDTENYESSEIDDDYHIEASNDEDSVHSKNEDEADYFYRQMSFEIKEVDKRLIEILGKHKIYEPTEIQKKAIPFIVNKHDVLGISKTGTGKTLAFILPILTNLLKVDKSFYCLIITPTRELSLQINKAIKMFEGLGIRSCVLIGGDSLEKQFKDLETHPHIVLGTPGRIFKHTNLKFRRFKVLVLDEADKFFEDDFKEEMKFIFEKLKQKRQNIFFTATCSGKLELACKRILNNSKIVDVIEDSSKKIEKLDERYVFIPKIFKECWIYAFLKEKKDSRIIIFVNMRTYVLFLSHFLKNLEIENRCLSGEQKQSTREEILDGFRKNQYNILISTDVGSRGIDIPDIDFVINYDIPYSSKDYIHRVGRTARAGKEGKSIVIVTQYDVPQFQKIEHEISRSLFEYDLKLNFREYHEMINLTILKANEEIKRDNEEKKKDQNRNENKY